MDKKTFRPVEGQTPQRASHCSRYAFMRADDGQSVDPKDYDLESLFLDGDEDSIGGLGR